MLKMVVKLENVLCHIYFILSYTVSDWLVLK